MGNGRAWDNGRLQVVIAVGLMNLLFSSLR